MVNLEILEGLKLAISKGETLQKAMYSFYSSGYKKEEIEEAAKEFQTEKFKQHIKKNQIPLSPQKQMPSASVYRKTEKPQEKQLPRIISDAKYEKQNQITQVSNQQQKPVRQISSYDKPKKKGPEKFISIIIFLIFLCLILLVSSILFKKQLISLLKNIFD